MNSVKDSAIIILGASGDLARRKLIPALDSLKQVDGIGKGCIIVGSGWKNFSDDDFRKHVGSSELISPLLHYHCGIEGLRKYLDSLGIFKTVIVFFSLPPKVYADTADALHHEGFGGETRIIIEKPFGYDLESARELNRRLSEHFEEDRIYRIDHYLAKEAVQNLLVFRFANSLFDPLWNSAYVESIQINASEEIGVESRGAYFDSAGVIRDMVQNHLIQMLALLTMEAPVTLDSEDIRNQKANVLKTMEVIGYSRGQYEGVQTGTHGESRIQYRNFRRTGTSHPQLPMGRCSNLHQIR